MEIATVAGKTREIRGRHANERLRRSGMVPAIIYGHGEEPRAIALSRHELEYALERLAHVIRVNSDGVEENFLLKAVQYDHLQSTPIHVDLMRVSKDERVRVTVPLEFRGPAAGTLSGGEEVHVLNELHIECPVLTIPDLIRVRVEHLNIGDAIHVKELELPADVVATHHPEEVVVLVRLKKVAAEAPVAGEAGAAEPEVIGRQAKDKEGEGAAK